VGIYPKEKEKRKEKKKEIKWLLHHPPLQDSRPEDHTSLFHQSVIRSSTPPIVYPYSKDNPYQTSHLPI